MNKKCKVIAEIGTLPMPDYYKTLDTVKLFIDAGADLVKTQMINWQSAFWANADQIKRYKENQWDLDTWIQFFQDANKLSKVPVFASVWDVHYLTKDLREAMPLIKIGYKALAMPYLIESALRGWETVFISCQENRELKAQINLTAHVQFEKESLSVPNVKYLYVIPQYPIDRTNVPLKIGHSWNGMSLHTNDLDILRLAFYVKSEYLEVHVQGPSARGPDCEFALTEKQFKKLIKERDRI